MIVVSDTSPITSLGQIGRLELLVALYGAVVIPAAVDRELRRGGMSPPDWIRVQSPADSELVTDLASELDPGEAEAIALGLELGADLTLIDERRGRLVARRLGLRFIGLLGVVLQAKRRGHLNAVRPVLEELTEKAGFWIHDDLRREVLGAANEL